ncbi:MAG: tetratricopeptide repeat protein [candidate division KSB1 bacterium]|nr:tetratricopeptide repeat protein [candidate division KSB1 bacterium]MDZ7369203.1 tetratricopeptide repeat protein [candidate division KSB1 bacterium]MDZ7407219.1 tetratricopeptide repeat protein [candidate division KSB1 bacterium]
MKITFFAILAVQVFLHDVITYAHPNENAEAPATTGALLNLDHNTRIDSLLQTAITQTILQRYEEALALIDLVVKSTPNEPVGYFFRAAVLQARMLDYEDYDHDEKAFFSATAVCRKLAQTKLKERRDKAWAHFFYGSAMGYEAFLLGKKKKYFEAFRYGWQSLQHLEAALKIEPQLHDACLGIGTYKYYRSKMSRTFSWLPFVKDEREEGIRMIRQAIAHGRYGRTAAINGLSWILIDENRPAEALALVDSALVMYPTSRFFLWSAGEAAYRAKRYDQAAAHYRLIISSLQHENRLSPYLELVGRTRLVKAYQAAGKTQEACRELERIGALNLSKPDRERGEEFLEEAGKYRRKCDEATNAKGRITEQK